VRLRAFGFDDIHALWGGRAMWATDDLSAEVRVADCTQHQGLLRLTLTSEEWAEVERLVSETGLLDAVMPNRMGVPDEARPSITLVTAAGETTVQAKWANDREPAFDLVFAHLLALSTRQPSG
jgi:hypothetical protein